MLPNSGCVCLHTGIAAGKLQGTAADGTCTCGTLAHRSCPAAGEINGKSNNLNNCLQHLYPKGTTIPNSEVVVVLDADMVPNQSFFLKVLEVMQVGTLARACTRAAHEVPAASLTNSLAWVLLTVRQSLPAHASKRWFNPEQG
jgi:hypothetical protein